MVRWLLVWQLTFLLVYGLFDTNFLTMKRQSPLSEMNCIDFSKPYTQRLDRSYTDEKRPAKYYIVIPVSRPVDAPVAQNTLTSARRFDRLFPETDDIVREHAKLVQDINSLRQLVFVSPLGDNSHDYDESIFHEIIETPSTTTVRPTYQPHRPVETKPTRANSFPVILLGGASQRHTVKKQPVSPYKSSINLVGTTITPVKHPYPFVMQATSRIPLKVCVTPVPITYSAATTRKPSVWEKPLKTILPQLRK